MYKYLVICISIKGKGSTRISQLTNNLRTFRLEVAKNNNVSFGDVSLTYQERVLCLS